MTYSSMLSHVLLGKILVFAGPCSSILDNGVHIGPCCFLLDIGVHFTYLCLLDLARCLVDSVYLALLFPTGVSSGQHCCS